MRALVYTGPGAVEVLDRPKPTIVAPTDAIVRLLHASICGTDLHILKGDVPNVKPGLVLGHEGVGVVDAVGSAVDGLQAGDRVLISCMTSCGACRFCQRGITSHCTTGGWVLGNRVDGTQAEFVRVPHATHSLHLLAPSIHPRDAVAMSDALPTGLECGALNANVQPGGSVVVIGAGPVGMAALLTARLYTPALIVMVDLDETRLATARKLGAHATVQSSAPNALQQLMDLTQGEGFDSVIEAVGIPATFALCQEMVAVGGRIANVGVHGTKVDLHLETLWDRNISIHMSLVNATTTPRLLRLVESNLLEIGSLVTHHFPFAEGPIAYATFQTAAQHQALKVAIDFDASTTSGHPQKLQRQVPVSPTKAETFVTHDGRFSDILGPNPTLDVLVENPNYPFAHEAGVFLGDTDELFVTSNHLYDHGGSSPRVQITKVKLSPERSRATTICQELDSGPIPMGNGGVNWGHDHILFCGQGSHNRPSGLYVMNARPPHHVSLLVSGFHGRLFNSVNDVVVHSDGSIWFTDPPYGADSGYRPPASLPSHVYRYHPTSKNIRAMADGLGHPNGICFSPDEKTVYVTDTDWFHGSGVTDDTRASTIYAYDIAIYHREPFLVNRRLFAVADVGIPDGIKCDIDGNVYSGCWDGVNVWSSGGVLLGRIAVGGAVANFCFGRRGELFIMNEHKLWRAQLAPHVRGALLGI